MSGAETKGRITLRTTWLALSVWFKPSLPTAPAMMMLGTILIERVMSRQSQGRILHFSIPSLTIWPDIVIPAEIPDSSKAKAKSRPAAGAIDWLRR